ncbi:MAG: bifunctional diaminohydroxyphosphoribosylaminopyrimidine deaminase/5-amino-6-(5-phosphoribosylamino)uracil reductase RibD [Candidatus Omnitrophica bacterium]|nr:bifunctional diaminohydroxyphosphoribosylaminopyrimidine deaminase/5-amino-6-(5-phosphoribosylamino)uracil reductase RibD [Candidatus Omnitrophota bacterium]
MKENVHVHYLKRTLLLAKKGLGLVSPNPMVGALIVRGNKVVGSGFHEFFGGPHAEVNAINMAGEKAKGARLYINLEPCCHWGKTPPCTDVIIRSGINEVVACMEDPNPLVSGKGFGILKKNGIKVQQGFLLEEAHRLNESYLVHVKKKRSFITLKWAMTLDGKIADMYGFSSWITNENARLYAKNLRFEYDGILVGINTIERDNPFLDYISPQFQVKKEIIKRKTWTKIILDGSLKTKPDANIFKNEMSKIIIFTSNNNNAEQKKYSPNTEVVAVHLENGKLKIEEVINEVYQRNIGKILVEGGTKILTSFWEKNFRDNMYIFIGNKIIGGNATFPPIDGEVVKSLTEEQDIEIEEVKEINGNVLLLCRAKNN